MKKLLYLFTITIFTLSLSSCRNDDDFVYIPANQGYIEFDGLRFPITYADIYRIGQDAYGENYVLVLSQSPIFTGVTNTEAYLYLQFNRPYNTLLSGTYSFTDPYRPIYYAEYFEYARLVNGNVSTFEYYLPDPSFLNGQLNILARTDGYHEIGFYANITANRYLVADFRGYLR